MKNLKNLNPIFGVDPVSKYNDKVEMVKSKIEKDKLRSNTTFIIRHANLDDCPKIYKLVSANAEFEGLTIGTTFQQMTTHFNQGYFECLLMEPDEGGSPIGLANFYHLYSSFRGLCLHLEDLYILPKERRKGYGRRLMKSVASVARERNCVELNWEAAASNQNAIDFYTSSEIGASQNMLQRINLSMTSSQISRLAGKEEKEISEK